MDASEWIALAAVLSTWIATASAVYAKLCVVTARVEEMSNSIRRLFEHWDTRPCERNTAMLQQLTKRVEAIEKHEHPNKES